MNTRRALSAALLALTLPVALPLAAQEPTTVVAWGMDYGTGQLDVPPDLTNAIQIAAADGISMAVRGNGTVAAWGEYGSPIFQPPPQATNVVAVSTCIEYALALRQNGTVAAWGRNVPYGETNVPPGLSNVVAVTAASHIPFALKKDSTVAAWGQTNFNQTQLLEAGLSNVVQVVADRNCGLALKADGTVSVLSFRTTPPPPGLSNIVALSIAPTWDNFLALRSDGTITGWTDSSPGYYQSLPLPIPADLTNIVAISAGSYGGLAITRDGRLRTWRLLFPPSGAEPWLDIPPGAESNVIAIAAAHVHNLALVGHATWPWITQQPQPVVTQDGATALFHVTAEAAAPLRYQWQFNGHNVPGGTNDTLTIAAAGAADVGFYSVLVSAGGQTIRSQPASLRLVPKLQIQANGNQLTLSWPLSAKGFWLEEATPPGLAFRSAFENVFENVPAGRMETALSNSPAARVFRLSQP